MTEKQFVKTFIIIVLSSLITVTGIMIFVDPCFHYHAPNSIFSYIFDSQRYVNNGISKNFEYNAIITGSSMTENFKTSELDDLFNVNSIKTPFSGASYKEVNDHLSRSIDYNSDIELIIRSLDTGVILSNKDNMRYDTYPTYIYDNNIFNDVNYLFNKTIIIRECVRLTLIPTLLNKPSITFDEYSNWQNAHDFGETFVLNQYERADRIDTKITTLSDADKKIIKENIEQNVTSLALENPQIEFYYFFTPYSILYFDVLYQSNSLRKQFEILTYASSLILEVENIKLFDFLDQYDIITNLNNYKDVGHYSEDINSLILQKMYNQDGLLSNSNYIEYLQEIEKFYCEYNYDAIFE